ncbi:hypothetical protein C1H46_040363 [Malus baccata]|uniref:Phosphoribulokinase/uridine kinase domain-containing protein n=1 Tax=Malus baccata TaxID=106549 RepID=A0A540KJB0_MALBA|nr:hypothetical protein C1H46_040363 [Malus baccata]
MAAVNMLSQPWLPTPSLYASSSTNKSNANTTNKSNANNKLHSYRNSVAASPYEPNRSNSPSKLSTIPTRFSKSGTIPYIDADPNCLPPIMDSSWILLAGSGCSWMQDNSMHHKNSAGSECGEGMLIDKLGLTPEAVAESIDKWLAYGLHLCRLFQLIELYLNEPQKVRLYHYYIPVFFRCEDQISQHRSLYKDGDDIPCLFVYSKILYWICFSVPLGCGKTTLVFSLDYLFKVMGRKSASISIDDFYLAAEGQLRGTAGSHDLPFSVETLSALTEFSKEGMKMKLCRYDKSAYNGKGDRADPSMWPEVEGPLTAVLFEGWMLGFKPLPEKVVKAVHPQLGTVNKNLEAYYAWYKFIKAWIIIKIKDPSCVYQWRLQAKIAMREAGKPEMSDDEVKDIVSRYLSEYNAYLPTLYSEGPEGSDPRRLILVEINEGRNPIFSTY